MVIVRGIWDAAVAAITTVGAEGADIIMDGYGAGIADGISRIIYIKAASMTGRPWRPSSHAPQQRVRSLRHAPLRSGRRVVYRRLGAFEDSVGDVPANPGFLIPACTALT